MKKAEITKHKSKNVNILKRITNIPNKIPKQTLKSEYFFFSEL